MTLDQQSELRLLQIRNAIADKERQIALANHEIGQSSQEGFDASIRFIDQQIEYLIEQLRKGE